MACFRQPGAQAPAGVEQVLVDRVAVGIEREREFVHRHVVERDRDEHLALARGELADRLRQDPELLAPLERLAGPPEGDSAASSSTSESELGGWCCQACRATLLATSKTANL